MSKQKIWPTADAALNHCRNTLFYGPPGTGKTHQAIYGGNPNGFYSMTLTSETPSAELRGHYIPKGNEFVWHDGPAVRAWREGKRLVLNEIDHASGDTLSFLLNVLDDPESAFMTLPTGETIKPHPDFKCVGTMNGKPEDLPDPLRDRFVARLFINEVHPQVLASFPEGLQKIVREGVINRTTSTRSWLEYHRLKAKGVSAKVAAEILFGDQADNMLVVAEVSKDA